MSEFADLSTRELATSRVTLVDELIFVPQQHGGETFYHIEVPSKSQFFRVGYREYVFLSLLDGETTFSQAVTITARTLGPEALTKPHALQVYMWLLENGLAEFADDDREFGLPGRQASDEDHWLKRINPFWTKVPLFEPDRMLAAVVPYIAWVFSPLATMLGLVLIGLGIIVLAAHWDRFAASAHVVLSPHNWIWMTGCWVGLKIVHEFAHGLACKRHGGAVRDMGLVFILFAPLAYIDVTASWRFASKWQRIQVAAAGMYVEMFIAAIALFFWSRSESELAGHLLYNLVLMASVSTILFNANPLMRFDGYYILADWLEIPNLYSEATRMVQSRARQLFFGESVGTPSMTGARGWITFGYGIAAFAWRLLICASLIVTASVMWKGAGIVLGVAGAICWFGGPLWRLVIGLRHQFHESRLVFGRAVGLGGALATAVVAALLWLPSPGTIAAPAIVEFTDLAIVRSRVAGFIDAIHVSDGQAVEAGQVLLKLRNEELAYELAQLQAAIEQDRVRHRTAIDEQKAAGAQIALRHEQSLREKLAVTQRRVDALTVRAPVAGRVVARDLSNSIGVYVQEGQELLAVGDEQSKELVISIDQDDIDQLAMHVGQSLKFRVGAGWSTLGTLKRIDPRASKQVPHPALTAAAGGPLAVTESSGDYDQRESRLTEPRFKATAAIQPHACAKLACGERGHAIFGWSNQRLGIYCWRAFADWLDERLNAPAE